MENSSELVEELTRQTDELMQRSASSMPRHGSLADQIVLLEVGNHISCSAKHRCRSRTKSNVSGNRTGR